MTKISLFGLTQDELKDLCVQKGLPSYSGAQLARWIYARGITNFDEMTDLSKKTREGLKDDCEIGLVAPCKVDASKDGTKKYLFSANEKFIEAAYIPDEDRKTLCVSSQVGCKMGCLFCMTGKQGFQAQLTSGQILNQIKSLPETNLLTNVVYMGMGEPLDNLKNVLASLDILTSDWGMGFSVQKVTLSSVGLLPALEEFIAKSRVRFALSLHNPFEDERRAMMPVQNIYPLESILDYLRTVQKTDGRRLSVEYICFAGVNDTPRHRKELVKVLHGLKIRVNLIRYHSIPDSPLSGSDPQTMIKFRDELEAQGVNATIRASRGQDIWAACGLLSTKALLQKAQDQDY